MGNLVSDIEAASLSTKYLWYSLKKTMPNYSITFTCQNPRDFTTFAGRLNVWISTAGPHSWDPIIFQYRTPRVMRHYGDYHKLDVHCPLSTEVRDGNAKVAFVWYGLLFLECMWRKIGKVCYFFLRFCLGSF